MHPKKSMDQLVVLVHGYFKNKSDMRYLENGLKNYGYRVISATLPTTFGSMDDCLNSLRLQISDMTKNYNRVHFVSHSMGGLIVHEYLKTSNLSNIGNCVSIATPTKGAKLATILDKFPMMGKIFKPLKSLKKGWTKTSGEEESSTVGIIAGTKNNLLLGNFFLSERTSDGRVEIESAENEIAKDFKSLPFNHKEIHHERITLDKTINFIRYGTFEKEDSSMPIR